MRTSNLRFTKLLMAAVVTTVTSLAFLSSASASHDTSLELAADRYRDSVREFERMVDRTRYFGSSHRRLVHDWRHAADQLRDHARRPQERMHRLVGAWGEVQFLQQRAASYIMRDPTCPFIAPLLPLWEQVMCAYRELAVELQSIQCVTPAPIPNYRVRSLPVPPSFPTNPAQPLRHPSQWRPDRLPTYQAPRPSTRPTIPTRGGFQHVPYPNRVISRPQVPSPSQFSASGRLSVPSEPMRLQHRSDRFRVDPSMIASLIQSVLN